MSDKILEALKLADAALSGANMNMAVVKRKIDEALAQAEQRGETELHTHAQWAAQKQAEQRGEVVGWLYRGGGPRPVSDRDEWKYWHGPERPVLSWDHQEIKPVYTAPPAPVVPEGWKPVPTEATDEMVAALRAGTIEPQGMMQQMRIIERIKSDYRKFIAAAPEVPRG